MTSQMTICIIIFVLTLIGFGIGGKYMQLSVIALIGMMAMVFTGCLSPETALAGFGNSSAILMAGMFVVAEGLNRTQMIRHISQGICKVSKGSFRKVLAGYAILIALLTQFIPSAIVCFSIVMPLALDACRELKVNPSKMVFPLGLTAVTSTLTLPLSAAISEIARIEGFFEAYDYTDYTINVMDITWAKWPVLVVVLILAIFVMPRFMPDKAPAENSDFQGKRLSDERLSPVREVIGYGTFVLVLVGMIFSSTLGIPTWQIAAAGGLLIVASGVLDFKSAVNAMNLNIVFLYVGSLGIANALSATGAADTIGDALANIVQTLNNNYLIGLLLFIVPFILTQFMLNLGVYSIFAPLYIMLCKSMGANPIGPVILCIISTQVAFFTPLATPVVPVMMGVGNYTMKDLLKMGILPFIVVTVVCVGWIMTVFPIV
ncbi:MAG TPA: anion permease [Candidatus Egerieimonas intestinavium]|uniref:Anion permease n=1 Tax=Candidatus Egerieimonas intestinavium TaxID=2840777 RepID=A0A9D1JGQ8_9FIRM|nr:anion permease [Candidatus Egerieimonas intestinavium]